jgi:STE24 endopeptidase
MRIGKDGVRRRLPVVFLVLLFAVGLAGVSPLRADEPATANESSTAATKRYHLPPDKLRQAKVLGGIQPVLYFGSEAAGLLALGLLLATGEASRLARWTARRTSRGWLQAAVYSVLLVVLPYVTAELPFAAIGHGFSLHYGISVEGWPAWLVDQAKTLGLTVLVEAPLLMLVFGLMHWGWSRRLYWLWFAAAVVPLMVLGAFLLPQIVEPLFYNFEPLAKSHPPLVAELERVVARTGSEIPPERMFLMRASEKSNGLNAYVSGLGASKRIVVWDTTADRMPADEILFTFAHETGHYVLHHIAKGLALAAIGTFALCWLVARLAEWMVRRWGGRWQVPAITSLPALTVLLLAFSTLQAVTEPVSNFVSRAIEHEADVYGQEAMHGIVADPQKTAVSAFNHLGEAYLDDPEPNPFIVFWMYDHPSIQDRAIFAAGYNPWVAGGRPQFFASNSLTK